MQLAPVTLIALLVGVPAAASEANNAVPQPVYVQVWLGGQGTDDRTWEASDAASGANVLGDLGTLPFGGGAWQKLWGGGVWQLGFEGGGLFTWKSDNTQLRGNGNAVQISVDSTFYSFGVFMGGVVSVKPVHPLRLYVAAGPSLTWAWLDNDRDDTAPTQSSNGTGNDASVVAYARAGIEFELANGFTFGASARYADDEFQFGNAGDLKFDEPLWLLTLGARL